MNFTEFVELISHTVWPLTILILAFALRGPVVRLLDHVTSLVKHGKTIEVKYGSASVVVEVSKSEELIGAMLELVQGMTLDEQKLLRMILDQPPKGLQLTDAFNRDSKYHETLRSLRDRNLVQPTERGRWKIEKHAMVTRIGHAILATEELRRKMILDGYPDWWKEEYEGDRFRESTT